MTRALLLLALGCGRSGRAPEQAPPPPVRQACVADVMAHPRTEPVVQVHAGERAPDVPLVTLDGARTTLVALAAGRPTLFVTGSVTCPVYQGRKDKLARLARQAREEVRTVLVYTTEAHPSADEPSPYTGAPWPLKFSDRGQTRGTDERLAIARGLGLGPDVTVVVDPLEPGAEDPFWCTFGPCPHCGFLVDADGVVRAVHDWFDARTMGESMKAMVGYEAPARR